MIMTSVRQLGMFGKRSLPSTRMFSVRLSGSCPSTAVMIGVVDDATAAVVAGAVAVAVVAGAAVVAVAATATVAAD